MTKLPWEDQLGAEATSKKILVIGDLILDNYLFGSVSRISPEAPVPVHHIEKKSQVAGGAANVAINCAKHKPQVLISGRIGSDEMGSELRKQLDQAGVDTSLMLVDKSFATTTKTRVLTKAQQILRFDEEEIRATTAAEAKQLAEGLPWKNLSAVVVSDYGKGFLSEAMLSCVFSEAKKKGIPCIVDPKGEDFSKYAGAFLITPNRKEAEGALQLSGLNCHRDKLCDQFQ
jgi:D-beta-D-heptose 7-phosphate kinase/D-beta-D-heptose 1-phosphate adenosyltransferase